MKTRLPHLLAVAVTLASIALLGGASRAATPLASALPPAASFTARVDNPWFPLLPGSRYLYTGVKDGKPSRDVVTVTHGT